MKKSIKYAGIAAATLLAVAPVAAPALSTVSTTVKAAAGDADQSDVDQAITNFSNQFGNKSVDDVKTDGTLDLSNITLGETASQDMTLGDFKKANASVIKSPVSANITSLTNQDARAYMVAKDSQGNTYDGSVGKTSAQLQTAMSMDKYMPVTFTVYLKYKDLGTGSYTSWAKAGSFDVTKSETDELTAVNAKFTTPLNVALNSKTAATQLVSGSNVSVTDQNGDSLATSAITPSSNYYYNYSQVIDNAKNGSTTGNVQAGNATDVINSDNEFAKAGTYYQGITYTAQTGSSLESMINAASTNPTKYTITINGKKASAGYDYVLTPSTTAAVVGKVGEAAQGAQITFVRAINVSTDEADWTESSVDGIVTTKSTTPYYTLKDNNNNRIKNRALAQNTAWKTDKMRTDQNGNKQYRVATGEWIDANDVTFGDSATTDTGALTDIKSVDGTVKLDNAGFTYFLYNKAGDQLKTRALAGNSSWRVINTAKDSEGNTYYRVATDEWVMQGNGVSFN